MKTGLEWRRMEWVDITEDTLSVDHPDGLEFGQKVKLQLTVRDNKEQRFRTFFSSVNLYVLNVALADPKFLKIQD